MTLPPLPYGAGNRRVAQIPTALDALCGFSVECGCGRTHRVDLKQAVIRAGALEVLPDLAREVGSGLRTGVVFDRVTREIAGSRVAKMIRTDGHRVREVTVPDGAGDRPHADEARLRRVQENLDGCDLAVSVGAGTINDLTKLASFRLGIPYISVATAPSMNGYTSAIAAVLIRGVKRTVDCHQPMAVVADLDILQRAPLHLSRSGLGDLESKPTATGDFRLGGMLRGAYYCPAPEQVVMAAEANAAEAAFALEEGDPEAVTALTEALILSGISMKLAGSSSTASGGEHLISHYWDMTAAIEGRVEGWHGAQVGVATIVTATLYEHLRRISPDDIDIERIIALRPSRDDQERVIDSVHGPFADEVKQEWFAKQLDDDDLRASLRRAKERWHTIWHELDGVLRPARRVRDILRAAGAPTRVTDLGLTPGHLRAAFSAAPRIRNRYTVLDFAHELGLFDTLAPEVLEASGCLG